MYPTNKDRTAVIDPSYHWQPISTAPLGKKIQLINEKAGVAVYGSVNPLNEQFFTHWAPLPTFVKVKPEPPPTVEYVGKRTPPPIRFGEYTPIPKWPPILVRVLAVITVVCVLVDIINSLK